MKNLIDDFKDKFLNSTWQDQILTFKSLDEINNFIASSNNDDSTQKNICLGIGFNKFGDNEND